MNLKTSQQAASLAGVSRLMAIYWARNNGVEKLGRDYAWTSQDLRRFLARNRVPGRKKTSKKTVSGIA